MAREAPPWYAWVLLLLALIAVSSAGAVFEKIEEVDPILKASWRLQATSIVLFPGFLFQWKNADRKIKEHWKSSNTLVLLLASGCFLWLHFGSWVWSLDHTTLTHSLLFVTAHPLVVVAAMLILSKPLHRWEIIGAIIGFLGAVIAIQDARCPDEEICAVTWYGDLAAFIGAITVVGYLMIGSNLRGTFKMPLFMYAFPVTLVAAILLTISSIFMEGTKLSILLPDVSAFGWIDGAWILLVGYLALGPGFVGHTGLNTVLRWFPPILISVTLVMEPLIGAIIGWIMGVENIPGLWTWIGGPLMISGTVLVTLATGMNARESTKETSGDDE